MDKQREMIKGISFLNPVDVDGDYYRYVTDYAIKNNYDHLQLIGPTHNGVRGNVDGMIFLRKYAQFNGEKDAEYVNYCLDVVNECTKKAHEHGIKNYYWHHELDLPNGFKEAFPETLNSDGDIEVTHPIVKDYIENRILDFYAAYPYMDGLILTLHETKVPLLKLKNQKLGKVERVKYVTEILYNTSKEIGKDLIVRPFASLEEDYVMMLDAYERISNEMFVMDKWTQFDWSLTAPHNQFYKKVKNNPLFVETDIFGEFFGKGRLPLMLKDHIKEKFAYCEEFKPAGYVSRIDRNGSIPFGIVNEINLDIMHACLFGEDIDEAIDNFLKKEYPDCYKDVRFVMEKTEDILKKVIYLKGYYYSELSMFPTLNHSKNHFYFEFMKDDYCIASNEWFIPIGWQRGSMESVLEEKADAKKQATECLKVVESLKGKMDAKKYDVLYTQFLNLDIVASAWVELTNAYIGYIQSIVKGEEKYEKLLLDSLDNLQKLNDYGVKMLGSKFHCTISDASFDLGKTVPLIQDFINETKISYNFEKELNAKLKKENLVDYVMCGGANESHKLQKEVNFSDSMIIDGELCRICGHRNGLKWSTINAHGWFSYQVKVKEGKNNIEVLLGNVLNQIDVKITVGDKETIVKEKVDGKMVLNLPYVAEKGQSSVRIRFDKISGNTPCIYTIKVK